MTHALRILFGWFSRDRRKARAEARRIGATLFAVVMGLVGLVLYLLVR